MNKLWLTIKNRKTKFVYTVYFYNEKDMNNYTRKVKYVKDLMILEDSRDIVYN